MVGVLVIFVLVGNVIIELGFMFLGEMGIGVREVI